MGLPDGAISVWAACARISALDPYGNCVPGALLFTTTLMQKATFTPVLERRQIQTADLVVVSGGAIESARLLLNSKSGLFPQGLGNRFDWVGRNLQGHAYSGARPLRTTSMMSMGPGAQIAICDFNHGNKGLVGGAMLANDSSAALPVRRHGPPGPAAVGQGAQGFMRTWFRRSISSRGRSQEMPVFDSRVQVDSQVRDHWGIPSPGFPAWIIRTTSNSADTPLTRPSSG